MLAVYSYFFIFHKSKEPDLQEVVNLNDLKEVLVVTEFGEVKLVLENGLWWVKEPHSYPANQELVEKALSVMKNTHAREVFDLKEDRFGLTPGKAFLEFTYSDNRRARLIIGAVEAAHNSLYVLDKDSQKVFVVHNLWGQFLYYPINEYYHKHLPIPGYQVKSVTLKSGDKTLWSVRPGNLQKVTVEKDKLTFKIDKSKMLWFFNRLREFEVKNLEFNLSESLMSSEELRVESDKGNIIFGFDQKKGKIIINNLNVFADYNPYSLKSLSDELEKVVNSGKK